MNREQMLQAILHLNCALELSRKIVGVKFLFDEQEFQAAEARTVRCKMNYCVMVKLAANGTGFKATGADLACVAGGRALGLIEIDDLHRSGQNGRNLGLYADLSTAKSVRDRMTYCTHRAYGVVIKPLEDFRDQPDVVLMVTSPYNAMRLVQGYSYHHGLHATFQMTGNQAICSESTALPYLTNDINVSLLCIGTRHRAGWQDNELAVGFAFSHLQTVTQGVMDTINIMDSDEKKMGIERKLRENGITEPVVRYHCNYYMNSK